MSPENVETARRVFDNFNRRDKAAWLTDTDPETEVIPPKEWPENAPIRGAKACWNFYVENTKAFEEGYFELPELIDAGDDKVVANHRREMRGKASGASIIYDFWIVITFRDGKGVRADWFSTRAEALEAAGLSE